MQQPKSRAEMDPRWTWKLNDILDGAEAFDALFAQTEKELAEWQKCQGQVAQDPRAAIRGYFALSHAVLTGASPMRFG